jgi:hypothetical protein
LTRAISDQRSGSVKAIRMQSYWERAAAIEAVGLSE